MYRFHRTVSKVECNVNSVMGAGLKTIRKKTKKKSESINQILFIKSKHLK